MDEFKAGDRVACVDADETGDETGDLSLVKGQTYTIKSVPCPDLFVLEELPRWTWYARRFTLAEPAGPLVPAPALRFNGAKPESDYILTYEGGIRAAFAADFAYQDTLQALARLYRDQAGPNQALDALRRETHVRGESIVLLIADTCARGSKKYAPGNYLKGGNWRQYFQGAVRHAERIQRGTEHDTEGFSHRGNFFWNVLMACHSVSTGLGTDDRIRPSTT